MDETQLQPRLLSIFRLYIALRLSFLALTGVLFVWEGGQLFAPSMIPYLILFCVDLAFLVIFLHWPWLQRRLGRLYLPLAITVASVIPITEANYLYELYGGVSIARLWALFPFLSVPLILTAWQYHFREVVFYCLATGALEVLLSTSPPDASRVAVLPGLGMVITRTALFLLIGYVVSLLVSEQRRQRHELAEANRQLVQYASTLERLAISRERNRLARELHDTLAHTLSGLAVHLEALDALWQPKPERAGVMVAQALAMTRNGLDETRRALQALRASPLEDLGLRLALRELAQQVAARNGLSLTLELDEIGHIVSPDVEQTFYRVAQEALENVARHAQAHQIALRLRSFEAGLELTVEDDGRGFQLSSSEEQEQFGLRGMQERAALVGAQLQVLSAPGEGTRIILSARGS